jgi:hypothetical protein
MGHLGRAPMPRLLHLLADSELLRPGVPSIADDRVDGYFGAGRQNTRPGALRTLFTVQSLSAPTPGLLLAKPERCNERRTALVSLHADGADRWGMQQAVPAAD